MIAFAPGSTITVALSTTTTAAQTLPRGCDTFRLFNDSADKVFVKFGASDVAAATAADIPIPAGAVESFSHGSATHLTAILASGTGSLYVTGGTGV